MHCDNLEANLMSSPVVLSNCYFGAQLSMCVMAEESRDHPPSRTFKFILFIYLALTYKSLLLNSQCANILNHWIAMGEKKST